MFNINNFLHKIKSIINIAFVLFNNKFFNYFIPNLLIKNIILIDPNKIDLINSIPMKFKKTTQFIQDFDWGKKNKLVKIHVLNHHTYITCEEIFIKKMDIVKTKEYSFFEKQISKFNVYKKCKNHNDIVSYLTKLVNLFEDIKKNGFKKNYNNNIEFMIDANLNLVKINSGNHRFAIARILKLKKIPIEIKVIHKNCFNSNIEERIKVKDINKFIKLIEKKYA